MKIFIFICFFFYSSIYQAQDVFDSGKLYTTKVVRIVYPKTIEELQSIVIQAQENNKKISIAGQRYSQGGQSHAFDSINIDLRYLNRLVRIDTKQKTVCVQAGMTWQQLQDILQPYNLSVKVMQSSAVFSIGGSLSVNVHGRDLRYGPIVETVQACTFIDCQGKIQRLSRYENSELFSLVIGGYGLFGVIVEVELSVTDNPICYKDQVVIPYHCYIDYFQKNIIKHPDVNLYFGRFIIIPGKNFLKNVISVSYREDKNTQDVHNTLSLLRSESSINKNKLLFNLYRDYYGQLLCRLRTYIELNYKAPWEKGKNVCRNQYMRPYIDCLSNHSLTSTDLLQEYFIPLSDFVHFTDKLRYWSEFYHIKLLNVTIRFVPKNNESFLSYAQEDSFSFVLYFTTSMIEKEIQEVKEYTRNLIDSCLECNGTFYLPYQQFASMEQVYKSYPMLSEFIAKKNIYDPNNLFINSWYANYIYSSNGRYN